MKHKHYDLIMAWANGAKIQFLEDFEWRNVQRPSWSDGIEYRIEPEPDVIFYSKVTKNDDFTPFVYASSVHKCPLAYKPNVKFTFDSDGNFKDVEKL